MLNRQSQLKSSNHIRRDTSSAKSPIRLNLQQQDIPHSPAQCAIRRGTANSPFEIRNRANRIGRPRLAEEPSAIRRTTARSSRRVTDGEERGGERERGFLPPADPGIRGAGQRRAGQDHLNRHRRIAVGAEQIWSPESEARGGERDGTGREGVTRNERIDIILETTLLRRSGSVRFGSAREVSSVERERELERERGECVRCAIKKRDGNEASQIGRAHV